MELTMFERLLQLPLFQGLTTQEISDVMSHVRLDFVNYHRGDEIVMQGESCRKLIYIISGEVMAEHRNNDLHFTLTEYLSDLKVIEPYNLFGMYQTYSRTYAFTTEGSTLTIDKHVMLTHLMTNKHNAFYAIIRMTPFATRLSSSFSPTLPHPKGERIYKSK